MFGCYFIFLLAVPTQQQQQQQHIISKGSKECTNLPLTSISLHNLDFTKKKEKKFQDFFGEKNLCLSATKNPYKYIFKHERRFERHLNNNNNNNNSSNNNSNSSKKYIYFLKKWSDFRRWIKIRCFLIINFNPLLILLITFEVDSKLAAC